MTTNNVPTLMPCPFCGSSPTRHEETDLEAVFCIPCGATIKRTKRLPQTAEEAWNRRAAIAHDRQQHERRTDADRAAAQTLTELTALIPIKDTLAASASCADLVAYFKRLVDDRHQRGEPVLPDGFRLIAVNGGFDSLMYWLDRCERKGHLENCHDLVEPWEQFEYQEVAAPQPAEPVKCDGNHGGPRCADPECWNDSPAEPVKGEPSDEIVRDASGETWMGMRVAAYRWETAMGYPEMYPPDGTIPRIAAHWSAAPNDAERLYRESDVRALLARYQGAQPAAASEPPCGTCGGIGSVIVGIDGGSPKTMPCPRCAAPVAAQPSVPVRNEIIELLATLLHFIPKDEPEIYRDTERLCTVLRDTTPPADEQAQQETT